MPLNIPSSQPGGGRIFDLEQGWGAFRRSVLRQFFPKYVAAMKERLRGNIGKLTLDVVDSRDLKFHGPHAGVWFDVADDPFAWRSQIPLARWGFAEILVFAGSSFIVSYLLGLLPWPWTVLAWPPFFFSLFVLSFFRDPHRLVPREANVVVSPADGKVTAVEYGKHPFFGEEPIARISIFLSVFNVHVNRMPADALVLRLRYMPGKFLDARNPESGEVNECMEIGCCEQKAPYRKFMVRQVAGAIARRIVTDLAPGERVKRGDRFGMIKFGSRTDLLLPAKDLTVVVKVGDMVKGGETVLAQLPAVETPPPSGPPPSGLTPAEAATTTYFPPPAAAGAYVPPAVEPPASEALHGS